MPPHEIAIIQSFIRPECRPRWRESLASPQRRSRFLDRLNHCLDFDPRYATELPGNTDLLAVLRSRKLPSTGYLLSATDALDGLELPITEAIHRVQSSGWGTVISCLPGELAFYYDELGSRRLLLSRSNMPSMQPTPGIKTT